MSESRRSGSARHYLIDGPLTARLQTILTLLSRAVDFPVVRINVLVDDTQYTISLVGGADPAAVPRSASFCDTVVKTGRPVEVDDAATDPRFAAFAAVVSGDIGSYLGVPLIGRESLIIGAICAIDPGLRVITADELHRLTEFGKVVEDQLDLIRRLREQRLDGEVVSAEVARAIRDGEIVPWYQPVIDLATGEIVGFEALARWDHPNRGIEDPRRFVPVAEDSDLIVELDLAVIRRALADLKRWQRSHPALRISVNLSARHFYDADCVASLLRATADAGVYPSSVDLELTETTRPDIKNILTARVVHRLREAGFKVWLDDFGTGWSALDHLIWLRVDGVKIDREVALALGTPVGDALTLAVTGLAAAVGLRTTIEGIWSQTNADLARDRGCDYGQGYFWAQPAPAGTIDDMLARPQPVQSRRATPLKGGSTAPTASSCCAPTPMTVTGQRYPVRSEWSSDHALAGAVLDALPDATAVLDATGMIIAVNHAWQMFSVDNRGNESRTGVGVNYLEVCERSATSGCDQAGQVAAHLRSVIAGECVEAELEYPCPSPAVGRWFLLRITRLAGPTPGVVASHVNITRRKMAEEELTHAASHDSLSGLANRNLLNRRLTAALRTRPGQRNQTGVGVLYIDLDKFKVINDTYGHSAGDEVLLTVARRLRDVVRPSDTVGRLGGDEFAVIAPRTDAAGLAALAGRIERTLAEPHRIHGHEISAHGSIGTHLANAGDRADDVIHTADQAMYSSKRGRQ